MIVCDFVLHTDGDTSFTAVKFFLTKILNSIEAKNRIKIPKIYQGTQKKLKLVSFPKIPKSIKSVWNAYMWNTSNQVSQLQKVSVQALFSRIVENF